MVFAPRFSEAPSENLGANDDFRFEFNAVGGFGKAGNASFRGAPLGNRSRFGRMLISPRSAEHAFGSLPSIWHVSDFFSVP